MENPARTARYRALIAERRSVLAAQLDALFPSPVEFVWEVGAGHGHFLTAYATAHPREICVGVDVVGERVERAVRKRDRARLTNLAFFQAEARLFLDTLPGYARIKRAFILFPDPWPKSRHHKHRILQPAFLDQVAAHATEDCRLYFRTDHAEYFEDARAAISGHTKWELIDALWPFEFATVFQSRAIGHQSLITRRRS